MSNTTREKEERAASPLPPSSSADPESAFAASLDGRLKHAKRDRLLPSLTLCALIGLFLSSGAGVAFSVLAVRFALRLDGDVLSRVLVFISSVVGLLYAGVHVAGARRRYTVTQHGPPWLYGNYLHASALLLSRLGFAVWIGAIITTALLLSTVGVSLRAPLPNQTIYLNLVICVVAFISLCLIIYCIEASRTPFKTALLTQRSFLGPRSRPAAADPDPASLSVSRRVSLEKAARLAAANEPDSPKFRLPNWTFPRKAKSAAAPKEHRTSQAAAGPHDDDEFEFMPASPTTPNPPAVPPVPAVPAVLPEPVVSQLAAAPGVCPYTGRVMVPPPVPQTPVRVPERVVSQRMSSPAVAVRRLTGPPARAQSIRRKPVPKAAAPRVADIAIPPRVVVGEPQTPKTPIDMVKEANRALSTFIDSPMFRRERRSGSISSESSSYSEEEEEEDGRSPFDDDVPSLNGTAASSGSSAVSTSLKPPAQSHSLSSSLSTLSGDAIPATLGPAHPPTAGSTANPPPISLALITNIIKRRSSTTSRGAPYHHHHPRPSGPPTNFHKHTYSAAPNPFAQIDEVDTPVDTDPPMRWEDAARAAAARAAAARRGSIHGIVVHEPDAMGNTRTARRLRRAGMAAANAGLPLQRSTSNFSRPLRSGASSRASSVGEGEGRRRGHRRSYSEHDAAGMMVRGGGGSVGSLGSASVSVGSVSLVGGAERRRGRSRGGSVASSGVGVVVRSRKGSLVSVVSIPEEVEGGSGPGVRRTSRPISPMELLQLQLRAQMQ